MELVLADLDLTGHPVGLGLFVLAQMEIAPAGLGLFVLAQMEIAPVDLDFAGPGLVDPDHRQFLTALDLDPFRPEFVQ